MVSPFHAFTSSFSQPRHWPSTHSHFVSRKSHPLHSSLSHLFFYPHTHHFPLASLHLFIRTLPLHYLSRHLLSSLLTVTLVTDKHVTRKYARKKGGKLGLNGHNGPELDMGRGMTGNAQNIEMILTEEKEKTVEFVKMDSWQALNGEEMIEDFLQLAGAGERGGRLGMVRE